MTGNLADYQSSESKRVPRPLPLAGGGLSLDKTPLGELVDIEAPRRPRPFPTETALALPIVSDPAVSVADSITLAENKSFKNKCCAPINKSTKM